MLGGEGGNVQGLVEQFVGIHFAGFLFLDISMTVTG